MTKEDKPYFDAHMSVDTKFSAAPGGQNVETRPPVRFSNGIVYEGSWKGDLR